MNPTVKKVMLGIGALLGVSIAGVATYAFVQVRAFDASMDKVYDIPPLDVARSSEPAVLARGKHLAESIGACNAADCHGGDFSGGKTLELGPIGNITGPNITPAGVLAQYSDGELARLLRHGVVRDARSVRFMPVHDISWLPRGDLQALVSFLRTVPPVNKPNGPVEIGILAKVLDRRGQVVIDVARRIDHSQTEAPNTPAPTAQYGALIARGCTGCHGDTLSGGRIPGAPPNLPVPANITPHSTGIESWTYADFERLLTQGIKKNGKRLDPFMPYEALGKMNDTEKQALWAYLRSIPPTPFGQR